MRKLKSYFEIFYVDKITLKIPEISQKTFCCHSVSSYFYNVNRTKSPEFFYGSQVSSFKTLIGMFEGGSNKITNPMRNDHRGISWTREPTPDVEDANKKKTR